MKSGGVAQIALFTMNRISTSGTGHYLLKDGSLSEKSTSGNYVDEYEITSGCIYYASGRIPPQENTCFVAYYDESKQFIGYEIDGTGSSRVVTDYKLTIPNNAKYAKIVGRANEEERPVLQCISSDELARQLKETRDSVNVSGILSPYKIEKLVYL